MFMNKSRKILFISLLLSLLLHTALLWLIHNRNWLVVKMDSLNPVQPEEVLIEFPENKPKPVPREQPREVVQNQNFNNEAPDQSSFLSDQNSRARNPNPTASRGNMPQSSGNSPLANLSAPSSRRSQEQPFRQKKFNAKALTGESSEATQSASVMSRSSFSPRSAASQGSNEMMDQKNFSVEELGDLTLNTYQWQWAPYVNAMRNKLQHVWVTPPAYYQLALISGYTVIRYAVNRRGQLVNYKVLKHVGHQSLKVSSVQAIESLFPFMPLPKDFPEEQLIITAKLIYPNLRSRR